MVQGNISFEDSHEDIFATHFMEGFLQRTLSTEMLFEICTFAHPFANSSLGCKFGAQFHKIQPHWFL
jgi:hypothetical protein